MTIADNLEAVNQRIARAARGAQRDPAGVSLVAVSKTHPAPVLMEALDAGVCDLGENRAQELREKAGVIGDRATWHFIGHVQTNKVRHVVGVAALVHSVDRMSVAEAVARRAEALGVSQDVLIEVNVSGEATKHGVAPEDTAAFASDVSALDGVALRGLMTMPPWPHDPEQSRPHYRRLARLRDELVSVLPGAAELSMGMTRDFEVAIEEGATIVRVGEAIFGPRR
ncbi:YggS family pyridoxal phosphate-dependent enzyme [soil metagenome]